MVFDRDFNSASMARLRDALQTFAVSSMRASIPPSVFDLLLSPERPGSRVNECIRDPNRQREVFLRCAPFVFERARGGTNAPGAKVNLETKIVSFASDFLQIGIIKGSKSIQVRDQDGIRF